MDITQKSLAALSLSSPIRYLCTLLRSPWIFSSLGWTVTVSSASLYVSCCHPLNLLCGPSLDLLQEVCIFLILRSPELDQALQMWAEKDHLPLPAGNTSPDVAWVAGGATCHRGALLTLAWCPPGSTGLSWPSCFPAGQCHAAMWSYSFPSAGLFISLCGC